MKVISEFWQQVNTFKSWNNLFFPDYGLNKVLKNRA